MLERAIQSIIKIKNLSSLLGTATGEDFVVKRLQLIDMARSMFNSMAIDSDGEDFDFKSAPFSGIKEIIDSTCNMMSAVSYIPQTLLFGRSPEGMNSTGTSDSENYYNYVGQLQKRMLKHPLEKLTEIIIQSLIRKGMLEEIPEFEVEFEPLWSLSEGEQATVEQTRAQTALAKAQTTQAYVDMGAIDPSEVRAALAKEGEYDVETMLDNVSNDDLFEGFIDEASDEPISDNSAPAPSKNTFESEEFSQFANDGTDDTVQAAAVIVLNKDGSVLCGIRKDNGFICGPGGHIEDGEAPIQAAIRETQEEFNITPLSITPLATLGENKKGYHKTAVFVCNAFDGKPKCDKEEMNHALFIPIKTLLSEENADGLFAPFKDSLVEYQKTAQIGQHSDIENSDDCGIIKDEEGNPNHDPETGQFTSGNGTTSKNQSSSTAKEKNSKDIFPKEIEGVSVPSTLNIKDKSFGKKVGKHAFDFGLNPSKQDDREAFREIVKDVFDNAEEVRKVDWRGYKNTFAFIKGKNVVIMNSNGDFITILEGGIENARVKNGRKQ